MDRKLKRLVLRLWRWRLARLMACFILGIAALLVACAVMVPSPLFRKPLSAVAMAADGSLLSASIAADGQWRFAQADSVPHKFATCIIAFEDKHFRHHLGIDPLALARAARNDLRRGRAAEGGSTITMQLARMARGNQARNLWQKFMEALWAVGIEMTHSKDEILALYASNAPMGGNVVGLEAASWRYFGRRPADLSWAESALLAVLPNAPARIHVARNRVALKAKRDRLLRRIADCGSIDEPTLRLAIAEPLPDVPYPIENRAPQLLARLTRNGGRTCVTTIDARVQRLAQGLADSYAARYTAGRVNDIGVLVAETRTGRVLAYVGNASWPSDTWMVDMVAAERSSGSTLKPFLYASMLSAGELTPKMLWADTPLDINGFTPQNYSHSFSGAVAADIALTKSLNVPLVRMLSAHNTGRFLADLKQLGFTTLRFSEEHYGASLILGGAEVSLWDLCGAYASLARRLMAYGGEGSHMSGDVADWVRPLRVSSDVSPRIVARQPSATPLSPSAIWHTFEAMSRLSRPEEEADWQMFSSMKRVAWKTGTSYGGRDAWAVGVTPGHVVGVWVGNATGEGRAGLTGVGFAAPVMFDVFSLLPSSGWFAEPLDDEDAMAVCRHSGMRASAACAEVDTVRLPRRCAVTPQCRFCRVAHLSADRLWQVNSSCACVDDMIAERRFVLPPAMEFYYRQCHADYEPLPPFSPACDADGARRLAIVYPQAGQEVVRTRSFDGRLQGFVCQAAAAEGAALFWHLDGDYVGQSRADGKMTVSPASGRHTLTVVDEAGQSASVTFYVR